MIRTLTIRNLVTRPHIRLLRILNTKWPKPWISFFKLTILRLRSNKWQVMLITKLVRMLHTKLSALSWSINHLRVVIVPLSVYLLTADSFRKDAGLLLVNYFLLAVGVNILSAGLSLFETFQVLLSWGDDCFLRILWANIVILMSLRASNSICSCSNCLSLILIY